MPDSLSPQYIFKLRESLAYLHEETARLIAVEGNAYNPTSQAASEHASYPKPDSVFNAMCIGGQLIESSADHLSVFAKILVEPIEMIASWTCIRSMLESCALATWLLDPAIDAQARVSRVFALRYEGMEQLLTFARTANFAPAQIDAQKATIDAVEKDALALGFMPVTSKKGRRIGIGEEMPSATDMIKNELHEEKMYRMLSAVAHGHHWAIRQLCYVASEENDEQIGGTLAKAFKKSISIDKTAMLAACGVKAFIRALWNQCRYFGWNSLHFEEVFENVADKLQMLETRRFWRDYGT